MVRSRRPRGILAALVLPLDAGLGLGSEPVDAVMYVSPIPAGRADGSRWSDAASIRRLPELLGFLPAGGEILVRADRGPYHLSKPIVLGDRGSSAPVTIRGVDPSGRGARPLIVGGRTALYSPETASTGRPAIALDTGADHLSFVRLRFKNFGNGGYLLRGAVRDLTISQVTATNVRRFIESDEGSRVTALSVRQTKIVGCSRARA